MNRKSKCVVIILLLFLGTAQAFGAMTLPQQRLARHRLRSLLTDPVNRRDSRSESHATASALAGADLLDTKIFADQYPANFAQRYPDLAHFSDGSGVAVWEDQRNGDWDIIAQLFTAAGSLSGGNLDLLSDPNFTSQRQPRVAVDGANNLALVWTEEEDAGVYAAVFAANLSQVGAAIRLDDAVGANSTNLPAVAGLSGGGFVVVWEDVRSGANIYGQRLGGDGSLNGSNFRINENVGSPTRLAPAAAADGSGNFAVIWEDSRDGESDVYLKVFNSSGVAQTADLNVADAAFVDSYQFGGQVAFVSDGYFVAAWISDRNAEQGVYGQLISPTGVFSGTNYQINAASADVCWDLAAKNTSDGGATICWANLSAMATIDYAFLGTDGAITGSSQVQDAAVAGERGVPALCWSATGGQAVWMDERNANLDIYTQQFDATRMLVDVNVLVNDDILGSQQLLPDVAALASGNVAVVWQDQRDDGGDIYLQITSLGGSPVGGAQALNDDAYNATQQAPRIGASNENGIMVVWEDNREYEAAYNKKIMGQYLSLSGNKIGGNILVSEDPAGAAQSSPAVAVSGGGYSLVVWTEESLPGKTIVMQAFTPSGGKFGGNAALSSPPGANDNLEPDAGLREDATGVASWTSVVGGRRVQYFQRLTDLIFPEGDLAMLALDTSQSQVLDADIFVHADNGEFYIAVVDSQLAGTEIKLFRYDESGMLLSGATTVATGVGGVENLQVTGDIDDALLVTWSQFEGGKRLAFGRLIHQFGYPLSDIFQLSDGSALATDPSAAMLGGQYFSVWCDNRTPGFGFDLYASSVIYTAAVVDDDAAVLPGVSALRQNYPNPFNPSTTITFELRQPGLVQLEVLNLLGQRVALLLDGYQTTGVHTLRWDPSSSAAASPASGVYFYRLTTEGGTLTRKMTLLK